MKEEIIEILKKNLPELEVEAITAQYKELKELRIEHEETVRDRNYYQKLHCTETDITTSLTQDLAKHESMDTRIEAANKRETELLKRELSLENSLLKMEASNAHAQVNLAKYFYEIPFKNRQVRETIHAQEKLRSDSVPYTHEYDNQGRSVTNYAAAAEIHETLEPTEKTTDTEES